MHLRPFQSADEQALLDIWLDSWRSIGLDHPVVTRADLAARLPHDLAGRWSATVAEDGGRLLGFVAVCLAEHRLDQLFVASEAQGRGAGTALFKAARGQMPGGFWLRTQPDNHHARSFYERRGMALDRIESSPEGDGAYYVFRTPSPTLETERLLLRPLHLSDAPQIQTKFPRWEIVKFLSAHIPWPYPPDGAETFMRDFALPAIDRGDQWHWSISPKSEPSKLIGVISLMREPDNNRGFWLDPDWQGQGLMTEACAAVTDFWFGELGQSVLRVPKAIENIRSRRLSERTGMRLVATGERDYVCGRRPAEVWEIAAEEWRARRPHWTSS
jgi:RimJ/RimL family protein N-acetyltransferase